MSQYTDQNGNLIIDNGDGTQIVVPPLSTGDPDVQIVQPPLGEGLQGDPGVQIVVPPSSEGETVDPGVQIVEPAPVPVEEGYPEADPYTPGYFSQPGAGGGDITQLIQIEDQAAAGQEDIASMTQDDPY